MDSDMLTSPANDHDPGVTTSELAWALAVAAGRAIAAVGESGLRADLQYVGKVLVPALVAVASVESAIFRATRGIRSTPLRAATITTLNATGFLLLAAVAGVAGADDYTLE